MPLHLVGNSEILDQSANQSGNSRSQNISTTPLRQRVVRQCLPLSWTTLRDKHCRHPIAVMGVVDKFGLTHPLLRGCRVIGQVRISDTVRKWICSVISNPELSSKLKVHTSELGLLTTLRTFYRKVLVNNIKFSCNRKVPSAALNSSAALNLEHLLSVWLPYKKWDFKNILVPLCLSR